MAYFDDDDDDIDDGFYEVEAIEKHRYNARRKKDEYFVKWKGYPKSQNTWVSKEDLSCNELLIAFERDQKKRPKASPPRAKRGRRARVPRPAPPAIEDDEDVDVDEEEREEEDKYKEHLKLPLGSWENKVALVEHISEPEGGDLVVYVKMRSGKNKFVVEKYPARVIKHLAPIKLIDYYEKHIIFSQH